MQSFKKEIEYRKKKIKFIVNLHEDHAAIRVEYVGTSEFNDYDVHLKELPLLLSKIETNIRNIIDRQLDTPLSETLEARGFVDVNKPVKPKKNAKTKK